MQKIRKENEWISDKTGNKFTELVIDPMFVYISDLLTIYVLNESAKSRNKKFNFKISKADQIMRYTQLAEELKIDIKNDKFTNSILKFVAPYFDFDSIPRLEILKQLEFKPFQTNIYEEKPKKVVRKITKNGKLQKVSSESSENSGEGITHKRIDEVLAKLENRKLKSDSSSSVSSCSNEYKPQKVTRVKKLKK
jgi:hypothetical protein